MGILDAAKATIEKAKEIVEAERKAEEQKAERKALRITARRRDVACRYREFSLTRRPSAPMQQLCGGPTPSQVATLREMKVPAYHSMTPAEAHRAIRHWEDRQLAGFASSKQVDYLARLGMARPEAESLTARQASEAIGYMKGRGLAV